MLMDGGVPVDVVESLVHIREETWLILFLTGVFQILDSE